MRELSYVVLDVFAERAFEGNPLAVFTDARGLTTKQMQTIARETNLSETTFVLPDEDPATEREHGVRVRIFTTEEELPFAGHPTLGTASWIRAKYHPLWGAGSVTLRLNSGPITVRFREGETVGEYGTMRQSDPIFGPQFTAEEVAAVIGMRPDDLLPGVPPGSVSTGNAFCIVALRDVETLGRLRIDGPASTAWLRERGIRWFYVLAPERAANSSGGAVWRARMQWHAGEDAATGSAAGPAIAWLVRHGLAASGAAVTLRQGVEIGRPSVLTVSASFADGQELKVGSQGRAITDVLVGGRTIPVAAGKYFLPDTSEFSTGASS